MNKLLKVLFLCKNSPCKNCYPFTLQAPVSYTLFNLQRNLDSLWIMLFSIYSPSLFTQALIISFAAKPISLLAFIVITIIFLSWRQKQTSIFSSVSVCVPFKNLRNTTINIIRFLISWKRTFLFLIIYLCTKGVTSVKPNKTRNDVLSSMIWAR